MREAAVIGSPVSHSLSPAIFSFVAQWLRVSEFHYAAREVRPSELKTFLADMRQNPSFVGLNVTIPHKEAIVEGLDETTPEARAVGAVNVVQVREGRLLGHNTDIVGVTKTLEQHHCRIEGEAAWVWGAGGAARAVCYALGQRGARIVHIANRDAARGQKLGEALGAIFPRTAFVAAAADGAAIDGPVSLLVNATPIGMKSAAKQASAEELFALLPRLDRTKDALAFDLIYNPERTPFLALAADSGLRVAGGLDMLIYQALATWEIWFGADAGLKGAKDALSEHLRAILDAR
ncbi:MAG: shikimate dehydrogenase [Polyangiaceae bacterium]